MPLVRRFRLPALFCALAVLVCELIARPYANMGICDDWSYAHTAQMLAATGHVLYNGWAPALQLWQVYLGAAFIKLFGDSLTALRMSTLLVAMAVAFLLQRTLVRAGISERNATIGTLALVLSPLYLMLSVTFMNDSTGLFGIVICLYGCLRALQASTPRAMILWICFAVSTNAIFGSSRQIAWLGILVMVPSTLWLLRAQRRVLLAGAAAALAGALFIFACLEWLKHQPYTMAEQLIPPTFPVAHTLLELAHTFLDIPFLLLPIAALFLPEIRKSGPRVRAILSASFLLYLVLAILTRHTHHIFRLEPSQGDWVNPHGIFAGMVLQGTPPVFLHVGAMTLLTIASLGGLTGLIASFLRSHRAPPATDPSTGPSWKQLGILLAPFTTVYALLLIPRATTHFGLFDRYTLELLPIVVIALVRYYQEQISPRLPLASILLVVIMAIYAITITHNTFAFYRARVTLAAELRANGVPDTSVDNGWEYNFNVELQHADHINDPRIVIPAHAYTPVPPPAGPCQMYWYDETPHIHPLYGVSFDPSACYGPAPFAPVHYSRWPYRTPGTLYVVRYLPPSKP